MESDRIGPAEPIESLVALEGVTARLRDFHLLRDTTWQIRRGQQWVVLGPNGSGKSALARTLAGELPAAGGRRVIAPGVQIGMVSFEAQQSILAAELEQDHGRHYSGTVDQVLTPRELFGTGSPDYSRFLGHLCTLFELSPLMDRPFRILSAGEMRKCLIVRALLRSPDVLILDEPFDGLDQVSRNRLARQLDTLMKGGTQIILVTHRSEEVPAATTHALTVKDLAVVRQGAVSEVLTAGHVNELYGTGKPPGHAGPPGGVGSTVSSRIRITGKPGPPLVVFRDVTLSSGGEDQLFRRFSWTVHAGEHWVVSGPNGSGKTTLVNLITGEDQRAYSINLHLFGRRRGSGESLWEIRRRLGVVTPRLQLTYSRDVSVLETVTSGFFDSVGLYQRPTRHQTTQSEDALDQMGIGHLRDRRINRISYGQRRLVLIARALVKGPELLLLDEPCQGLDPANRSMIVEAIDRVCRDGVSTVVYITHHEDEIPRSISRRLRLERVNDLPSPSLW